MHYSRLTTIALITAITVLTAACANTPHNDVLIFGTNTKLAFDVSSDPANAGTPSFTLGYKRQEVAWVPLRANGTLVAEDGTTVITDKGSKYIGTDWEREDTYSVFASFGGKFATGAENTAALSQFFATGIAAQNLGKSSLAASMVSVQPVDQEQLKDAKKRAEKAEEKAENVQSRLITLLGEKPYNEAKQQGASQSSLLVARKNIILASVAPGGKLDKDKWDAAVDKTSLDVNAKTALKAYGDYEAVNGRLTTDAAMSGSTINALYNIVK